ncbi:MAG: histidine kinase [Saprospiraceae bacterium]|nr:histidine kinase [Saprospiraceae bacterium]
METQEKVINRRLQIGLHIALWLLAFAVHIGFFSRFYSIEVTLLRGLGNILPLVFIFYLNLVLINRLWERGRHFLYMGLVILIVLLLTFIRTRINLLFPNIDRASLFLANETFSWRMAALVTNIGALLVSALYQILQNRKHQEQQALEIINRQNEAQLQFLRAQINPHFLFNTLNNIYALAVAKSDKTANMVLRLSNLLRYVVYDGKAEQVALPREIEHINQYIELFQLRSEKPANISFAVEGQTEGFMMEPMILIPIVENCLKHCDFDTNDQAYVRITLTTKQGMLFFQTVNSKSDNDLQKDKVGGVGLENIRKRLLLKYPDRFSFEINDKKDTFEVRLEMK